MTEPHKSTGFAIGENAMAALAVAVIALVAVVKSKDLEFGSLAEIGPGLFPAALSFILLGLCLVLAATSWRNEARTGLAFAMNWRAACCILGALCVFALTIRGIAPIIPALGVVGAAPLAILLAGLADPETKWRQLSVFAVALTAFCTLLFRFLLGLPLPVAPIVLGY
jgi:putative tricarboxylic transport membrane protein